MQHRLFSYLCLPESRKCPFRTANVDSEGAFQLDGDISDGFFSSPEPYLKVSGDCAGDIVIDQIFGLPCAAVTTDPESGRNLYGPVTVILDGADTPPPSSC